MSALYPNPSGNVQYLTVSKPSNTDYGLVQLRVYDLRGMLVKDLSSLYRECYAGELTTLQWSSKELSTGVYMIKVSAGGESQTNLFTKLP